jgi:high frequency lysogenization protein
LSDIYTDRTLALAGIFQASYLVQQIARTGTVDPESFDNSVHTIFVTDAPNTEAVFGGAQGVALGLSRLHARLQSKSNATDMEVLRYVINLLYLERKLAKRPEMLEKIHLGIERAKQQAEHFSHTHTNVLANLAGLYSETISMLTPRILVHGEQSYLSNPDVVNKIRTLLLAGIRSAVLWRQKKGSRLQLLFGRRQVLRACDSLLMRLENR